MSSSVRGGRNRRAVPRLAEAAPLRFKEGLQVGGQAKFITGAWEGINTFTIPIVIKTLGKFGVGEVSRTRRDLQELTNGTVLG